MPLQGSHGLLQQGDDGPPAGMAVDESSSGLNLGQHRAGSKMSLLGKIPGFRCCEAVQELFVGLPVMQGGFFYGGQDQQELSAPLT